MTTRVASFFMSEPAPALTKVLDLETLEVNLFRGRTPPTTWHRVFGGQVIGQALMAASRTVEGIAAHSLHAYFILPGDVNVPIVYEVERTRDGKSFPTRIVKAIQHGRPIFTMMASFHNSEDGLSHQVPMPDVPPPESLPSEAEIKRDILPKLPEQVRRYYERERPIELRPVEYGHYLGQKVKSEYFRVWFKTKAPLPDDAAIHQCVLAYASDMTLLDTALVPLGRTLFEKDFMGASLDHALWLHRPFRADEWLLYSQESPNLHGSRGLARGLIFRRDGTLVATVAQEGLVRLRTKQP
jgi:acyl-CoA thioesterase-2